MVLRLSRLRTRGINERDIDNAIVEKRLRGCTGVGEVQFDHLLCSPTIPSKSATYLRVYVESSSISYVTSSLRMCTSSLPSFSAASCTSQNAVVQACWSTGITSRLSNANVDLPAFKSPVTGTFEEVPSTRSRSLSMWLMDDPMRSSSAFAMDDFSSCNTSDVGEFEAPCEPNFRSNRRMLKSDVGINRSPSAASFSPLVAVTVVVGTCPKI